MNEAELCHTYVHQYPRCGSNPYIGLTCFLKYSGKVAVKKNKKKHLKCEKSHDIRILYIYLAFFQIA